MAIQSLTEVGRNDLCPCGSGLKYKHCHGDEAKRMICAHIANEAMARLIHQERKKHGLEPCQYTCDNCGHGFDEPKRGITTSAPLCPKCDCANLTEIKSEEENEIV